MGIGIELYRARIGCFSHGGRKWSTSPAMMSMTSFFSGALALVVIMTLLIIGGIEQNPGPLKAAGGRGGARTRQQTISSTGDLQDWKKMFDELRSEIDFLKKENSLLKRKMDFLESQTKINNLIIHGVQEENEEVCEEKICQEISAKLNIVINKTDFEFSRR